MDQIYPRDNKKLAEQILAHEKGCIISEFPLGSLPESWHFPQRNRIISGLCQGVVIVQATAKSGSSAIDNLDRYAISSIVIGSAVITWRTLSSSFVNSGEQTETAALPVVFFSGTKSVPRPYSRKK